MTITSIIVGSVAIVFTPILIRKILRVEKITPASVIVNQNNRIELEMLDAEMSLRLMRSEQNLKELEKLIKKEKNEDEKKSLIIDADELKDKIKELRDEEMKSSSKSKEKLSKEKFEIETE